MKKKAKKNVYHIIVAKSGDRRLVGNEQNLFHFFMYLSIRRKFI